MPPPQPNMQQILKQAQKMQAQVAAAQASLVDARAQGSAGGGLVSAEVTGTGELVGVTIQPEVTGGMAPEDLETLCDLVVAAVRDAQREANDLAETTMAPFNQGLPGLPF